MNKLDRAIDVWRGQTERDDCGPEDATVSILV